MKLRHPWVPAHGLASTPRKRWRRREPRMELFHPRVLPELGGTPLTPCCPPQLPATWGGWALCSVAPTTPSPRGSRARRGAAPRGPAAPWAAPEARWGPCEHVARSPSEGHLRHPPPGCRFPPGRAAVCCGRMEPPPQPAPGCRAGFLRTSAGHGASRAAARGSRPRQREGGSAMGLPGSR